MAKYNSEGGPTWVRCYDNGGESADRYTVLFTRKRVAGQFMHLGMSAYPCHPQGVGMHGFSDQPIDRPAYGHLGKRIHFHDLPAECRALVAEDYADLWSNGR